MNIFDWLFENLGNVIFWSVFAVIILFMAINFIRNRNHDYTAGSGLFKNSEYNLNKDEHVDPSDYEYYNNKGNKE